MPKIDELKEQAIELAVEYLKRHITETDGENGVMDITLEFKFRPGKDVICKLNKYYETTRKEYADN